jgi:hypothetical protein
VVGGGEREGAGGIYSGSWQAGEEEHEVMAGRVVDRGRMGRWRIDRRSSMTGGGAESTYGGEGAGAGQGGAGRPWACRPCMRARRHHLPAFSLHVFSPYVRVCVCSVLGAAVQQLLQKVKLVFSGTVTGESTGSGCTVPAGS